MPDPNSLELSDWAWVADGSVTHTYSPGWTFESGEQTGIVAVALLTLLSVMLYLANKKLWYPVKHGGKQARL